MALIFMDGFDKYGAANSNSAGVASLLAAGEWTSSGNGTFNIVAGLSATGQALSINPNSASPLSKTLSTSYSRLIGGFRFSSNLGASAAGVSFGDAGSQQCSLTINGSTGTISLRNGLVTGTALATSSISVSANSTHYLEWDIAFGNSAAYAVYLDGAATPIISGTGDTTATANNTANQIILSGAAGVAQTIIYDDLYLFDTTGTTNNTVLLTSPRIETSFPTSDGAVQFGFGAGILGSSVARAAASSLSLSGYLYLRRFVPTTAAATLGSITMLPGGTSGAALLRGVVYADSAGVPGALMTSGSTITGVTAGVAVTLPLTTPQSLSAGVPYWLGFMTDTNLTIFLADSLSSGTRANVAFASGAPGTAPGMVTGVITFSYWGNLSGITGNNYDQVNQQPPDGIYSYVLDSVVGHEDLYNFAALSAPPSQVYAVAIKANAAKSDAGTRTVSMRVKSGATDSGGSATGQAMGTSFGWLTSLFPTDPNTGSAWTGANVNAAQAGFRVDS